MYNQKALKGVAYCGVKSLGKDYGMLQIDMNNPLWYYQTPSVNYYKSSKSNEKWHTNSFQNNIAMNRSVYTIGMNSFLITNPIGTHHLGINKQQYDHSVSDNIK